MDKYDFSGWATRNDLKCSDGRIIRKDAFKHNDGKEVPVVWNHQHDCVDDVLGHAMLENREDGVYAYCTFNDSESGKTAKLLVQHGDINQLSIYANQLKQQGPNVMHGNIREISLVLAGANPGAFIDNVIMHGEEMDEEAVIYTGENIELYHSEEGKSTREEKPLEEKKEEKEMADNERTVQDVFDEMTEEQKNVVYAMVGMALEESGDDEEGDEENMKHNVFDNDEMLDNEDVLSHSEMEAIIKDGKKYGSLKESFLAHADDYGITNIDYLFPEAQNVNGNTPGFVKRTPDGWVGTVMTGVHHSPFSRIKMMFADLREDEARAKGYMKGNLKKEEVFGLLKRTVEPTTVYKKQKLDRDDVIDITDFDVVSWLKSEMRMMLDEEIARAILFGDGRSAVSEDKISEKNIIPIVNDADFYAIKKKVTPKDNESLGHAIITAAVKSQDDYEGSGNTTFFTSNSIVTDLLLMEDADGRRLYKDVSELALALNVNRIVKVPASIIPTGVYGVIVDLSDYNVGADKGGSINMFDDFDIDYNQMKYLIETRCSGALTKPYSAIVLKNNA